MKTQPINLAELSPEVASVLQFSSHNLRAFDCQLLEIWSNIEFLMRDRLLMKGHSYKFKKLPFTVSAKWLSENQIYSIYLRKTLLLSVDDVYSVYLKNCDEIPKDVFIDMLCNSKGYIGMKPDERFYSENPDNQASQCMAFDCDIVDATYFSSNNRIDKNC